MKKRASERGASTVVEMTVMAVLVGLLGAVVIPNFVRARTTSQVNVCINNLRQIDAAKRQWFLETHALSNATPVRASLTVYLGQTAAGWPACPANGTYTINGASIPPTCSISHHVLP